MRGQPVKTGVYIMKIEKNQIKILGRPSNPYDGGYIYVPSDYSNKDLPPEMAKNIILEYTGLDIESSRIRQISDTKGYGNNPGFYYFVLLTQKEVEWGTFGVNKWNDVGTYTEPGVIEAAAVIMSESNIKPNYKNKPNQKISGTDMFHSRSVAVVMRVSDGKGNILLLQRSKLSDDAEKWCLPCGYLDWNESGEDACSRELFEETGIFIPSKCFEYRFTITNPMQNKQNVLLVYDTYLSLPDCYNIYNIPNSEIDKKKWINPSALPYMLQKHEIKVAFEHDKIIEKKYN